MKKKFAIVLALFLIAVVCSAGCIDPEDPVDPIDPVDPVDPVDPITPVDPVVPEEPEKPVDPVVPEKGDFTVTFMMNSAVDSSVYLTKYVDEGKTVAEPAAPEKPKENYVFVKWTTDKENKHAYDFTTLVTADLVLYADWDVKGTSSGSGHSHNWGAGVETTAPTCGAEGVMTYTCNCGETKTESIPATGQHPSLKLSSEGKIVCAVCKTPLIAQIDTVYYSSFESAMDSAEDGNTIKLLAAVTNGDITKNVVIDTNKTATSLKYAAVLEVADIKINQSNSDNLGAVMLGDEEVFFEVDDSNNKLADSNGNLIVAYTKKGSTYTVYTSRGLALAITSIPVNTDSEVVIPATGSTPMTTNLKVDGGKTITIRGETGNRADVVLNGQIATTSSTAGTLTIKDLTINVDTTIADSTGISQTEKSAIAIWGNQKVICDNVVFVMSLADSTAITSWWSTGEGTSIVVKNSEFNCNGQRPIRSDCNVDVQDCTFNDPYRYAVQLTSKASTATGITKANIVFMNNEINNGEHGKDFVYGIQLEGAEYGCHDLVITGEGNTISTEDTDTKSTMYYCECGKVDHTTTEWNTESIAWHEDLQGYFKYAIGKAENTGESIYLPPGTYTIPSEAKGKTLTIIGTKDTVIKHVPAGQGEAGGQLDYNLDGSTVTFRGVTFDIGTATYSGWARAKLTCVDCVFNGHLCLNADSSFEKCDFNIEGDQYNIWTWGAKNMKFTDCKFYSDGKALLLYQEGTNIVNLEVVKCTFYDSGALTSKKAAIEIGDAPYGATPTYNVIVSETTVNGYEINDDGLNTGTTLWANKNSMPVNRLNVYVDGVDVY